MIDAHHHFWHYQPQQFPWINGTMTVLQRDFLAADMHAELVGTGITGVVSVQARQITEETDFLLAQADQNPLIRGVVGWAPLIAADVQEKLENYAHHPKLKGYRHVLHDELDDQYMLRADFNAGLSRLAPLGLCYDILIFARHLPFAIELVDRHPDQIFILDHVGKPDIQNKRIEPWKRNMASLAERPNVVCKLSGMVTQADWAAWTPADLEPYVDAVLDSFGPNRMMFGSDWPVCIVAGGYRRWIDTAKSLTEKLSADEGNWVWHRTATTTYRL